MYNLFDVIFVSIVSIIIGSCITYGICGVTTHPISKDEAATLKHILSYVSTDFRQMWRNNFGIENDEVLSKQFPSWAAANVFTKRMMETLDKW